MTTNQTSISLWILIVSSLIAIMEIMVSIFICYSPGDVLETVDISARGVDYLMYMWAVRQFALGCVFAFATIKKSIPMLTISYIFFLVMFIGDLVIGILQKENSLILSAIIMCCISSGLIYALNKKKI